MITDDDVKKLSKVFATKEDLKALAKQDDLLAIKKDVARVETKVDRVKTSLDELSEYVVPALGNIFRWTDSIHRAIVGKPMKSPSGN